MNGRKSQCSSGSFRIRNMVNSLIQKAILPTASGWQSFAALHAFRLQSPELRIAGCRSSRGPSPWAEETERRKEDEMTQDVADDGNVQG